MKNDTAQGILSAACVAKRLRMLGIDVLLSEQDALCLSDSPQGAVVCPSLDEAIAASDVVVAVGGDGTIFHAAAAAMLHEKPVLGVNAGRLGFLAQAEGGDLSVLDDFAAGRYTVEERLVLEVELVCGGHRSSCYAVNDAVICKPDFGHVAEIEVRCCGDLVGAYRSDGIIFATPTGSTAYSLSAGGPIADPAVDCIIMTPIAAHSLVARSIVFASDKVLSVTAPNDLTNALYLIVDGQVIDAVTQGTTVTIRKSDCKTRFVCLEGQSFYYILNEKMKRRG